MQKGSQDQADYNLGVCSFQSGMHHLTPNYYQSAVCSQGNACQQICVSKGCKHYAIVCSDRQCKCYQAHLSPQICSLMPPQNILEKLRKKQVDSPEMKEYILSSFQKLIDWLSDQRDKLEVQIKNSRMTDKEKQFLELSSKLQFKELTGQAVCEVLEAINKSLDQNFIQTLQKEFQMQWNEIVDPIKVQIQSLEAIFSRVTQQLEGKFSDNIIQANYEDIKDEDIKDYVSKNKIKNPTELHLYCNKFQKATIEHASLKELNLSYNEVKSVRIQIKGIYALNHSQLTKLILDNNQIKDIVELAIADLPCLVWLNLSCNQLSFMPEFVGKPQLKQAYFGWNQLEDLKEFSNSKLNNLQQLYLNANNIRSIEWFVRLLPNVKQLKNIVLDDSKIEQLPNMSILQNHQVKLTIRVGKVYGGKGNPISKYSDFLKTSPAAFEKIEKIQYLSLTAKNEQQFKLKEKEFRSIDKLNIESVQWCKEQ